MNMPKRDWVGADVGTAHRGRCFLQALGALAISTGCDEPLVDPQAIEGVRVLGARLEVEGEPTRATPRAGEAVALRWLVAAPEVAAGEDGGIGAPAVAWAFSACEATPDSSGVLRCTQPPLADAAQPSPRSEQPVFRFTLPADLGGGTAGLSVVGAVCGGPMEPSLPADQTGCASGEEGTRVVFGFDVSEGGDGRAENHNPTLGAEAVSLAGTPWLGGASQVGPCVGAGLRQVRAGSGTVSIGVAVDATSAETLERRSDADPVRETLLVAHFSTGGELDRVFSRPKEEGKSLRVTVHWTPPGSAPPGGQAVRLYFVLRDDRGGADFAERTVCVVP